MWDDIFIHIYVYGIPPTPQKLTQKPKSNHRKWAKPWKTWRNNAMYRRLAKIYCIKPKGELTSCRTHRQTNEMPEIPVCYK